MKGDTIELLKWAGETVVISLPICVAYALADVYLPEQTKLWVKGPIGVAFMFGATYQSKKLKKIWSDADAAADTGDRLRKIVARGSHGHSS